MLVFEYDGINDFLVGISKEILNNNVKRNVKRENEEESHCYEFPEPVCIKLRNPRDRYITIKKRNWRPQLSYSELLWILLGRNDLDLPAYYVKNLRSFSDDNKFMRAGYGPRIRAYNSSSEDYTISKSIEEDINGEGVVDQLKYVIEILKEDLNSRQAVISIHDPIKDCFDKNGNIKKTKDQPCSRLLQFQINNNKLDLTVYMRSNDIIWGASAVNIFNFTFIQELVSDILDVELGNYYHIVNNMHYYSRHHDLILDLSKESIRNKFNFKYKIGLKSLEDLDKLLIELSLFEKSLRVHGDREPNFENDLFQDWANIFRGKKSDGKILFVNPTLNCIMNNE